MRGFLVNTAAFVGKVKHLSQRSTGLYYFRIGVPEELRPYFGGKREIVKSLKTTSLESAVVGVERLSSEFKRKFADLRGGDVRDEAIRLLKLFKLKDVRLDAQPYYLDNPDKRHEGEGTPYWLFLESLSNKHQIGDGFEEPDPVERKALDILLGDEKLTLTEAMNHALEDVSVLQKEQGIRRAFLLFVERLPTQVINNLSTKYVQDVCKDLVKEGSKYTTVRKRLNTVRSAVREFLLYSDSAAQNPFEKAVVKSNGDSPDKRHTFTDDELLCVREGVAKKIDLQTARIAGLLIDTGARIGEIGGLKLSDIVLDGGVPFLKIQHNESRRLKNKHTAREVPLTGDSLEYAAKVLESSVEGQIYAFERYNKGSGFARNSCSNAVNKLLKSIVDEGTSHSFRHKMRDRLLRSGAGELEINLLQGWSGTGMVYHYGTGDGLERLNEVFLRMHKYEKVDRVICTKD